MNNPVFTAKHYNKLWQILQSYYESTLTTQCDEHRNFLLDLHKDLEQVFKEDNPRFKRDLWALNNQTRESI